MGRYSGDADHRHDAAETIGVLLVNLGSPDAPTTVAVRRYLAEFLWDPRVVEIPRPLWWLILHGLVLRTRPPRSAHAYQRVWTEHGSPLLVFSQRQARALQQVMTQRHGGAVQVVLAMRYGNPSIRRGLEQLRLARARRVVVLPLYPQYSAATTGTAFDHVSEVLRSWRWVPALRFINHYHDHEAYIAAVVNSVRESWAQHGPGDRLLLSYHGMPKRTLRLGDPYFCHCQKTARLIAERLALPEGRWQISFQSRFGRAEWLQPYTDKTLRQWAREGFSRVDVVCPGFAADCLETLEEIAMMNKEAFLAAGGERLHYIPALNDRPDHIAALADLVDACSRDWWEGAPVAEDRLRRARMLGAER